MQRIMLKSKIHRGVITDANLYYEGSFTVDKDLMAEADIKPYEKVAIVNINNGERLETYVIPGESGSGQLCLNGAAARKGAKGDEVIIISYANMSDEEIENYKPTIILLDRNNKILSKTYSSEPNKIFDRN
jgi:aspartate 1-decarboxylase